MLFSPTLLLRPFSSLQPRIQREYLYFIDTHGQLFLHDTTPKNFTTCYKDKRFLDFFFRRLSPNTTLRHREKYEWTSPCGKELNYIHAEDTPIVFQDLTPDGNLVWAGTLIHPFDPARISVDVHTGHLYHPSPIPLRFPTISTLENASSKVEPQPTDSDDSVLSVSLLRSSLILNHLADHLDWSSERPFLTWNGTNHPIRRANVRVR